MTRTRIALLCTAAIATVTVSVVASPPADTYPATLWSSMRYRDVGPFRGGRVTAVTGVASEPYTYYMGSTGGGVWKTTDAGHSWQNISDGFFASASMGAVEVAASDPNIVWAGTGSSKIRSNVSIGRGIYKSTDAGRTWTFMGLRDVGQIATVRVHPTNPNIVYVAAQGNPFVANAERGVYRTNDGGKTWKLVLHISDTAGAADLELQPGHPEVVFAAMWHGQRKPWTIISGAKEGGIYKSSDGGDNWSKLAGGLPNDLFGRANVAISNVAPNRIYALIEAKPGSGLYRSEDAGATWSLVNGSGNLITRPFYYDTLGVDPTNADVVWIGNEGWFKSTDGGKSFRDSPSPHSDNHDVWINPKDSRYMVQGNDGGAVVSIDGGRTWSPENNQPTAEIYQVAVDEQYPYLVYGAQQDDDTVVVPSEALGNGQQFRIGPGCETGPIMPDKDNPAIVYGGCKGQFSRWNMTTSDEQQYWVGAESLYGNGGDSLIYRFQRVSPMEVSHYAPHTVYYGSQYLHRSPDGGKTWLTISPDLTAHPEGTQGASGEPITRDATGEEVYSTLYAIRESKLQKGLIWTGSNDGLVYVTRDDGKTWTNVTPAGLAPGGRVQNIDPSPLRPGTAYVAIYRYLLGDFAPYIYRTDDFGKTWTRLTDGKNGIAADEPTRVVREDPNRAGLLYAGTEFGMYVSFDNGGNWQKFQMNLPVTPVTDIAVAHKDLVVSTQGRGFWILDNLTPLHQAKPETMTAAATLFAPREAIRTTRAQGGGGGGRGAGPQYTAAGAQIDYFVGSAVTGDVTMEVLDGSGAVVRKFTSAGGGAAAAAAAVDDAPPADDSEGGGGGGGGRGGRGGQVRLDKSAGLHRFVWDERYPGPWQSAQRPEGPNGPMAPPGEFKVRLTVGAVTTTEPLKLVEDPRVTADGVTQADLQGQFEHNMAVRDLVSQANQTVSRLRAAQIQFKANDSILPRLNELSSHMLTPTIRYSKPELVTHITYLYSMTNSTDQAPGADGIARLKELKKELAEKIAELDKIIGQK